MSLIELFQRYQPPEITTSTPIGSTGSTSKKQGATATGRVIADGSTSSTGSPRNTANKIKNELAANRLSLADEKEILAWLASIEETDQTIINETTTQCHEDPAAR
ncbi:hypothetical protein [Candidatus Methylobacter favarea]|uniref:hypothetical protein n=1 Tax=Candidatus Methylobacter favarea TaxID=2707345 RepID=UPI00157CDFB7|nr:hypothetical protein [Candidatus Methylobacter favarea]